MRFSIIIPAHNAADRIRAALEMIKVQSFADYELIVVCDACDDNTHEIAESYGARVFDVDNHSAGLTRNKGLDEACGEWVMFLDDDDHWIHPYVLEMVDQKLRASDESDILQMGFYWKGVGVSGPLMGKFIWPNIWSKAFRREFIGDTRFSDAYGPDDLEFVNELLKRRPRLIFWDTPIYFYNYMRPGSITDRLTKGDSNGSRT